MDSIFKFKKPDKKKIGGVFDADDKKEWCLLTKPQIGNVTLFIHFHKLWCVTEVPEVQEDEANGIEYQVGVQKQPVCEIYFGFVKDDKFVVEKYNTLKDRIDDLAQNTLNGNIQRFLDEGYAKDWNNYKGDEPIVPNYYGHQKDRNGNGIASRILGAKRPHQILKTLAQTIPTSNSSNP